MLLSSYLMRVQSWCDRTQLPSFAWHGRARAPVPTLAWAIPTILALSAGLGALPSSALYTVHKVQQSIPMADGGRLSATLYMPDNAKPRYKFPPLTQYLPYRQHES